MGKLIIEKLNSQRKRRVPKSTKLVLVGLTPGRAQHKAMNKSSRPRTGAFSGQMRNRLFDWFNELGINDYLGVEHKDDMFLKPAFEKSVFMTSLLREPVYYANGKNYSGRSPVPWKDERLIELIEDTVKVLKTTPPTALIVPCGDIVSRALMDHFGDDDLNPNILDGFPHPSPLNVHAPKKLKENKKHLRKKIKEIWS